ncbi:hypothetical protein C8Q73DRAFT_30230 [Cubamyces lactineus]|nr:hypothetical protein C8Q73DRAFT_30230 [Cubamyces lactineus]
MKGRVMFRVGVVLLVRQLTDEEWYIRGHRIEPMQRMHFGQQRTSSHSRMQARCGSDTMDMNGRQRGGIYSPL